MKGERCEFAALLRVVWMALCFLPFAGYAKDVDEQSPTYWDDAARQIIPGMMPFALPPASEATSTLQIRKLCIQNRELVAQVFNSVVHFNLDTDSAYALSFPFNLVDMTCSSPEQVHILALSWPDRRLFTVGVKAEPPWPGWRRGDPIELLKDEVPLGYVEGDRETRVLTTHRLLSIRGDKVARTVRLNKKIELSAAARVAIVRAGSDIYFGNDGGEFGGTLYRLDESTGKISLVSPGLPVVSIVSDPVHDGCVLVARAVSHVMVADGELTRACHATTQTLIRGQPVWSVSKQVPIFVGFSDGFGELKGNEIVNRQAYPAAHSVVAGLHYSRLPGVMLVTSGISQSVSISGPTPMMVQWPSQPAVGSNVR